MRRGFTLLLPLLLSLAGCPHRTSSQDGPAELTPFTSASELKAYLADQYRATHRGGLFGGAMGGVPTSAEADNASGSGGYSSTNIQEEGVDESDVLKTDGTYLYVLANQKLDIIQAVPADAMSVVGRLDLDLPGSELYLSGSRAIVLARPSNYYWYDAMPMAGPGAAAQATVSAGSSVAPSAPGGGGGTADGATEAPWRSDMMTFDVYIVDVGKPDAPALVRKYSFQGDLLTSRMVGGKLYLVSYTWPSVADPEGVSEADVADILPKYRTVVAGQESVQPLVGWAGVYHPANPDGYSIINVTTLDTGNLDAAPASTGAMAGYGVVYASTKALYVSSPNWDPYGAARDQTDIHKFSLTGQTAQYVGSGRVPGWLLNQFSLGEQDDLLRVATTEGHAIVGMPMPGLVGAAFNGRMPASENHVVVLEQVGNKLEIAGRIDGIAPGEQLYAARFVGNRGFLVTFQKIDPLFTVDLSDPRNPVLAGELEVPGYSEYIHMIDENHLLTIGKDAQPEDGFAWYLGLKLSIFDVSDLAHPTEMQKTTLGVRGTDSEALRNHKAFTYFNGLLAFPVDLYEGNATPPSYGTYTFGGLMVYRVGVDSGFQEVGRIATTSQATPWYWDYNAWTRGVFIGQSVYAAYSRGVKAAAVTDMTSLQSTVDLP